MAWKKKIDKLDILALIACILIATISVCSAILDNCHICEYCHKKVYEVENEYVVCYGYRYYHAECYLKKLKEEAK